MTTEELRTMDVEIHTKVMGESCYWDACTEEWCDESDLSRDFNGERFKVAIPEYTTSMAAAWQVVEKLSGMPNCRGVEVENAATQCGAWGCTVWWKDEVTFVLVPAHATLSETAPLAICKAALKAVEAK